MHELNRALVDIRDIRRQVAQTTEFRGYGPATLCGTAVFAIAAGFAQAHWAADAAHHPAHYVTVWASTAVLSAALIATQTLTRVHRMHSGMADEMVRMAALQFLPAALAGVLLPAVLLANAPRALWLVPGLLQIIYSLGVFASCRFLPRPMLAAGTWYLATGLLCISLGDDRALSPALMAGAFAIGQLLIAAILYVCAARDTADAE